MIAEECTSSGPCVEECPNEAIPEEYPIYVIDPEKCTECVGFYDEPQCVSVCPVECIVPNSAHRVSREELLAKKERLRGA